MSCGDFVSKSLVVFDFYMFLDADHSEVGRQQMGCELRGRRSSGPSQHRPDRPPPPPPARPDCPGTLGMQSAARPPQLAWPS